MNVVWLDRDDLFPAAVARLETAEVVLDIGCGINPQRYLRPLVHICCEPYQQYVEVLQDKTREAFDRTFVIIKGGWRDAVRMFPPGSVDTVFLVDVIEHLEKEEARELLLATERLARRQIALFTPLGFMPQHHDDGKDAWGLDGALWQEHRSGWQPDDFDESWEIYACRDYHETDNMGKELDEPFGAMWVIKNCGRPSGTACGDKRQALIALMQRIIPYSTKIDVLLYNLALDAYLAVKYSKTLVRLVDLVCAKRAGKHG